MSIEGFSNRVIIFTIAVTMFLGAVQAEPVAVEPEVPQYDLPLAMDQIYNSDSFSSKIPLSERASGLLEKNGFVVVDDPYFSKREDITSPYEVLKDEGIPIFITTDSLLHLYHIQFDETLRTIEEEEFYDDIWELSRALLARSEEEYQNLTGDAKEAARRNMAFFSVGLSLLQPEEDQICQGSEWECDEYSFEGGYPYFEAEDLALYSFTVPSAVEEDVKSELALIDSHSGFAESPVFGYDEDYSQYVPRGHYTRSEKLKNYFKAMMWYGRMSFLLKGCEVCIVSENEAKIQTIGACMIAENLQEDTESLERWERIYQVTSFYVGYSDDLGPYEYNEAINSVFGGSFEADEIAFEEMGLLKAQLAGYRIPKIYGGTGITSEICQVGPPFSPEAADQCLAATAGFRLMGQRFIPDSYIFQNLVYPYVGDYTGDGNPFTAGAFGRHFPRGLDVMALLGSERADEILDLLDDSSYNGYENQRSLLHDEFSAFGEDDWQKNLYWSWLYSLMPLLEKPGAGYPTFMQTSAWQDKELTTALASWTELRHDTILYAKQSYTMVGAAPYFEEPKPATGYVEPVPEFFSRLLELTRITKENLTEMGVLDPDSSYRLDRLETILEKLVDISIAELNDEELSEEDYQFIEDFGDNLDGVLYGVDSDSKKTTIVADVHTDPNTGQVLEEGVGYVRLLVVAYKVPDGRILLGAGPVFSYYEFKQPMAERLTDEAWRTMLAESPPEDPEWASCFGDFASLGDLEGTSVCGGEAPSPDLLEGDTEPDGCNAEVPLDIDIVEFKTRMGWNLDLGWYVDCTVKLENNGKSDGFATLTLEKGYGMGFRELEIFVPAKGSAIKTERVDVNWDDELIRCRLAGQSLA